MGNTWAEADAGVKWMMKNKTPTFLASPPAVSLHAGTHVVSHALAAVFAGGTAHCWRGRKKSINEISK